MRVLLTSRASYDPPRGGSTRSNLIWLRELARRGHECHVVAAGDRDLESDGIRLHAARTPEEQTSLFERVLHDLQPDRVLVSSEDLSHVLLRRALALAPGQVAWLAHTPQFFPFGPESWNAEPDGSELVQRAAGLVAIGHYMGDYIELHAGATATVIHPPIYGDGPFERFDAFMGGAVTMINPCAVKGISIFTGVAGALPGVNFAALPGWGTTAEDLRTLAALPNITIAGACPDIRDLLRGVSVLLMPSLWYEGFGLIVMEAMLRGIPVIASDSGGLLEAKQGTGYVIPVQPIRVYEQAWDERHMPRAVLPEQDVAQWAEAVSRLTSNREAWREESDRSRAAALEFVSSIDRGALERFLLDLHPASAEPLPARHDLTPAKRELLLKRLRGAGKES